MTPASIDMPAGTPRSPPAAGVDDPMGAFAALFDIGLRAANETVVGTAKTRDSVFRAYIGTCDAARQIISSLLVDWHQRFLNPSG
jgi:hypothetical protein